MKKPKRKVLAPGETAREIKDLEYLIRGHLGIIRAVETDISNDEAFERRAAHCRKVIEKEMKDLQNMIKRREHGPEVIADSRAEILKISKKLLALKHRHAIEKLMKLQEEINEMTQDSHSA